MTLVLIEIFSHQLFKSDIEYLLSMEKLWQSRTPPTPLQLGTLPQDNTTGTAVTITELINCVIVNKQ